MKPEPPVSVIIREALFHRISQINTESCHSEAKPKNLENI